MSELLKLPDAVLRRSLGLPLVLLGFMLVYVKGASRTSATATAVDYVVFGFGAAVTLAGLSFMAVELRRIGAPTAEVESAVNSSDLEMTIKQLAKNLDIQRAQATQGFAAALVLMVFGVCAILSGALGELFGFSSGNRLTTIAGTVVEVVSGLGLVLFRATFARVNKTSDSLLDIWKILAAFKRSEALPDSERTQVQVQLIGHLIGQALTLPAKPKV